jgi:hypothetical protein
MSEIIHLHWLWHMGPKTAEGVTKGASLCGKLKLPRDKFVSFKEDATCERCLQLAIRVKSEEPSPPPKQTPQQMIKKVKNVPDGAGTIKMLVKTNIKKPGSGQATRFGVLLRHDGKTVKEFLAAGGNPETLKNAIKDGNAEIEQ